MGFMNFKTFISLVVAVSLGLAAVWAGRELITERNRPTGSSKPVTSALAVKHDMEPGDVITPEDVSMVELPTASIPAGAFTDINVLKDRALMTGVVKGQVLFEGLLAPQGAEGGLTALVPKG